MIFRNTFCWEGGESQEPLIENIKTFLCQIPGCTGGSSKLDNLQRHYRNAHKIVSGEPGYPTAATKERFANPEISVTVEVDPALLGKSPDLENLEIQDVSFSPLYLPDLPSDEQLWEDHQLQIDVPNISFSPPHEEDNFDLQISELVARMAEAPGSPQCAGNNVATGETPPQSEELNLSVSSNSRSSSSSSSSSGSSSSSSFSMSAPGAPSSNQDSPSPSPPSPGSGSWSDVGFRVVGQDSAQCPPSPSPSLPSPSHSPSPPSPRSESWSDMEYGVTLDEAAIASVDSDAEVCSDSEPEPDIDTEPVSDSDLCQQYGIRDCRVMVSETPVILIPKRGLPVEWRASFLQLFEGQSQVGVKDCIRVANNNMEFKEQWEKLIEEKSREKNRKPAKQRVAHMISMFLKSGNVEPIPEKYRVVLVKRFKTCQVTIASVAKAAESSDKLNLAIEFMRRRYATEKLTVQRIRQLVG